MEQRRNQFVYTLLGYVLILVMLLVVALIIGVVVYLIPKPNIPPSRESIGEWSGLAVFTVLVFGYTIRESRARWNDRVFWATLCGLLFLHIISFWAILRVSEPWSIPQIALVCMLEQPFVMKVLNLIISRLKG